MYMYQYNYVNIVIIIDVDYIMDNNYTLMDITNHTTRWGVWSPSVINLNQSWAEERGLNSLQILAGLLSAFRITGNTEYYDSWKVRV